jgi:hypothetical protein
MGAAMALRRSLEGPQTPLIPAPPETGIPNPHMGGTSMNIAWA